MRFQSKDGTIIPAKVRFLKGAELNATNAPYGNREQQFQSKIPEMRPNEKVRSILVVTPSLPLPEADDWSLAWDPLKVEGGGMTDAEAGILLGTVPFFRVSKVDLVQRYDADDYIDVSLNKRLPKEMTAEKLQRWLQISPEPEDLQVVLRQRGFRLLGKFQRRTYRVGVSPGLLAIDGSLMKKRYTHSVEVTTMLPHLSLPAFGATQYAHGDKTFEVVAANLSEVRVRVKKIDPANAANALATYGLYESVKLRSAKKKTFRRIPFEIVAGKTVMDKTWQSKVGMDESDKIAINWGDSLGDDVQSAMLFVSVEGKAQARCKASRGRQLHAARHNDRAVAVADHRYWHGVETCRGRSVALRL